MKSKSSPIHAKGSIDAECLISFLVLGFSVISSPLSAQTPHIRAVALAGDSAPGYLQQETFSFLFSVSLNNNGNVAFGAVTTGGDGIWTDRDSTLQPVFLSGTPAPDTTGDVRFADFSTGPPHINNVGDITFVGDLYGADVSPLSETAIWKDAGGLLRKIVRQGDVAVPGQLSLSSHDIYFSCANPLPSLATEELFCSTSPIALPLFNDAGHVIFQSELSEVGPETCCEQPPIVESDQSIWVYRNGILVEVVRSGESAPGAPGEFKLFPRPRPPGALNNHGDYAFSLPTTESNSSIWLSRGDGEADDLDLIIRAGQSVGATLPGVSIQSATISGINDARQIAFRAILAGSLVNDFSNESLWLIEEGSLSLLAREGDPIPGTEWDLGRGFASVALSGDGTIAFSGELPEGRGIFSANLDGGLKLYAYSGMQAPGTEPGTLFNGFIGATGNVAVNGSGQVAFLAHLDGPGVNGSNDRGLWVTDREGELRLVFRSGQRIEVRPGDTRKIGFGTSSISSGNQDGVPLAFNDRGEIAFYTDWGILVSSIGTIPEPSSVSLGLLGLVTCAYGWRSRA